MSPRVDKRKHGTAAIAAGVVTLAVLAGFASTVFRGGGESVSPVLGNVLVAPNGSDSGPACVWSDTMTGFPGDRSTVCATLGKAKAIATSHGTATVLVGNGAYNASQSICRGTVVPPCVTDTADATSGLITFKAETQHGPVIHGTVKLGSAQSNGDNPPSYVTLDGIDVEGQILTGYNTGETRASHITIRNGHVYQVQQWRVPFNPLVLNAQVDQMTLEHMQIGPGCCNGDALGGGVADSDVPVDFTVQDSTIHDMYDSCQYLPTAVSNAYGPCDPETNTGFGDGCSDCAHVDGLQFWGADGFNLLRNRWYAIGANGDPTGQTIFMESDPTGVCAYFDHVNIVNNAIYAGGTGNNTVFMGLSGGAVTCSPGLKNIQILYNTVWATGTGNIGLTGIDPETSVVLAGNIVRQLKGSSGPGCPVGAKGGGTMLPTYRNNLIGDGVCDASDHQGNPSFVAADPLAPDQRLVQNSQWAINAGEATYCPATDVLGVARPVGPACDVGAYEGGP